MTIGQFGSPAGQPRAAVRAAGRQRERQRQIVTAAMAQFAAHGYEAATIEQVARAAGVAKGAVIGYYSSKAGLFLAAYQAATRAFNRYLDAPAEVCDAGFFAVITYWLERTSHLVHVDLIAYRVVLLGNYCADLHIKRGIPQFLLREDPYGTADFIAFSIARGEVRADIDIRLMVSLVGWLMDRFQDALVTQELDPGLFGASAEPPEVQQRRVRQFIQLLRGAIGTPADPQPLPEGGPP